MKKEVEKKRRSDIIFGIMLASVLGVLLNLFSNIYYDVFVTKNLKLESIDGNHVTAWIAIFLATWGFISFFIHDYENNLEINNVIFWKRFANYFFESFKPVRFLRVLVGIYLSLFLLALIIVMLVSVFIFTKEVANTSIASIIVSAFVIYMFVRAYNKYLKKK